MATTSAFHITWCMCILSSSDLILIPTKLPSPPLNQPPFFFSFTGGHIAASCKRHHLASADTSPAAPAKRPARERPVSTTSSTEMCPGRSSFVPVRPAAATSAAALSRRGLVCGAASHRGHVCGGVPSCCIYGRWNTQTLLQRLQSTVSNNRLVCFWCVCCSWCIRSSSHVCMVRISKRKHPVFFHRTSEPVVERAILCPWCASSCWASFSLSTENDAGRLGADMVRAFWFYEPLCNDDSFSCICSLIAQYFGWCVADLQTIVILNRESDFCFNHDSKLITFFITIELYNMNHESNQNQTIFARFMSRIESAYSRTT